MNTRRPIACLLVVWLAASVLVQFPLPWVERLKMRDLCLLLPRWQAGDIEDFGAYLRRAVVNQVKRTFLRRGWQRRSESMLDRVPTLSPEEQVVRQQLVWSALRTLTPRQRTAVVLHYYEALPVDEVAYAMGTSVGTAKSHLSRGRDRLRELLGERP